MRKRLICEFSGEKIRNNGFPKLARLGNLGALAYFVVDRPWSSKHDVHTGDEHVSATADGSAMSQKSPQSATRPEKSIAVLPFTDMSAEKDQEYMSDGIAEELVNLLTKVPDLKVIARTSSFAFKGGEDRDRRNREETERRPRAGGQRAKVW
jgi:hypothetical protein